MIGDEITSRPDSNKHSLIGLFPSSWRRQSEQVIYSRASFLFLSARLSLRPLLRLRGHEEKPRTHTRKPPAHSQPRSAIPARSTTAAALIRVLGHPRVGVAREVGAPRPLPSPKRMKTFFCSPGNSFCSLCSRVCAFGVCRR